MDQPQGTEPEQKGGRSVPAHSRPSSRTDAPAAAPVAVGSRVALRKGHPCGANEWELLRLASDAALRCTGCARVVILDRPEFLRRVKRVLQEGPHTVRETTTPETAR